MPKVWTVRAKLHICDRIPKGFTVYNLVTQQNVHDYYALRTKLQEMGIPHIGGHEQDDSWEWF